MPKRTAKEAFQHETRSRTGAPLFSTPKKVYSRKKPVPKPSDSESEDEILLSPTKLVTPQKVHQSSKRTPIFRNPRNHRLEAPSEPESSPTRRVSARLAKTPLDSVELHPVRKRVKRTHQTDESSQSAVRMLPTHSQQENTAEPPSPSKSTRGRKRKNPSVHESIPPTQTSDAEGGDEQGPHPSAKSLRSNRRKEVSPIPSSSPTKGTLDVSPTKSTRPINRRAPLRGAQIEVVLPRSPSKYLSQTRGKVASVSVTSPPLTDKTMHFPLSSKGHVSPPLEEEELAFQTPTKQRRGRSPNKRTSSSRVFTMSPSPDLLRSPVASQRSSPLSELPNEDDFILLSPTKSSPSKSPRKKNGCSTPFCSPLEPHLYEVFEAQKLNTLKTLRNPPVISQGADETQSTNDLARQQLSGLLAGTLSRGEGNSCFILGPRGSGKTRTVEDCIQQMDTAPIVIRLSGWVQTTDRQAMREIATQLTSQTGKSFMALVEGLHPDEDEDVVDEIALPPSQLPKLISSLPSLPRPTVIVLDGFDLFALHARQSLLYCLFDTAQNCRGTANQKGIAVVGVTSRVDTLNLLEKRVKSRFSGRVFRTAGPPSLPLFMNWVKITLLASVPTEDDVVDLEEWREWWTSNVENFVNDKEVKTILLETFSFSRDLRVWIRLMTSMVMQLDTKNPYFTSKNLAQAVTKQRIRPAFPHLKDLPYAFLCLMVASYHREAQGHDVFNFRMLHESFSDQSKASRSAPVQINGATIGMKQCSRKVLVGVFETLIAHRIFIPASASAAGIGKEYAKYRCAVDRVDIKFAVEKSAQSDLKRWLHRAGDAR